MTNATFTVIQAIIDRSGSMHSIRSDAEGGFNAFIESQRTLPGQCQVSLARFDDEYEVVYTDLPIDQVPPLVIEPRGTTAMLDAIGRTVVGLAARLAALPEGQRPGVVIVGIVTDGLENASREFGYESVKQLITQQERDYGWRFLYMGADQDAVEQGARMGVAAGRSLSYDRRSSAAAYDAMSGAVSRLRSAVATGAPAPMSAADFTDEEREGAN